MYLVTGKDRRVELKHMPVPAPPVQGLAGWLLEFVGSVMGWDGRGEHLA